MSFAKAFCFAFAFLVAVNESTLSAREPSEPRLTVDQWLSPLNGKLSVQVVHLQNDVRTPLADAEVQLVGPKGLVFRGVADDSGMLSFAGVPEGAYALLASSDHAFGYYALHVVEPSNATEFPSLGIVTCGNVNKSDFESAVSGYLPMKRDLDSLSLDANATALMARQTDNGDSVVRCVHGVMTGHLYAATSRGETKARDAFKPAAYASVFLYQNGKRIDHKLTGETGTFQFRNVLPGSYTIVSVGPDGLGAVGVELVADTTTVASANGRLNSTGKQLVSQPLTRSDFAMQVVPCCPAIVTPTPCCEPLPCCDIVAQPIAEPVVEVAPPEVPVETAAPVPAPTTVIGGGTGFGGGGAGVGGFGGAGVALPAAAAALAAASNNRDSPWVPPAAASPDTCP
ncbi:MAG: carboxypeptidase-like regulatory domain-containing protein [Planctomycetota bacterium]